MGLYVVPQITFSFSSQEQLKSNRKMRKEKTNSVSGIARISNYKLSGKLPKAMEITHQCVKREHNAVKILEKDKTHFSKVEFYPEVQNLIPYM